MREIRGIGSSINDYRSSDEHAFPSSSTDQGTPVSTLRVWFKPAGTVGSGVGRLPGRHGD
jgi:hypothetical protein